MSVSARERSSFGQFQMGRSPIRSDLTQVKTTSTGEMAALLRDGVTLAEVAEAFDLSWSTVQARIIAAGWSSETGEPILRPEVAAPPPPAPAFQPQPWADQALCAQTDPETFYPEKGGTNTQAKAICGDCMVASECLDYALTNNEHFGVWGGLSEHERRGLAGHTVPCTDPDCTDLFATEKNRNSHVRIVHEPSKNPVTCHRCGRVFNHSGLLAQHLLRRTDCRPERTTP